MNTEGDHRAAFARQPEQSEPLLAAEGLVQGFAQRRGPSRGRSEIRALDGVDLAVTAGTTLAVVGESGSGKTTLARCLALLERPDSGSIRFAGEDLLTLCRRRLMPLRRQIQLIFQDPANALNPRFTAAEIVAEPLRIQNLMKSEDRRRRALRTMEQVGLLARWADRRPGELSGGQRQRLAVARALILEPRLLILDEALAALDLSVQAQIVNLLLELQLSNSLTYLYISHDLSLVRYLADEVAVMHRGRIVERGPAASLLSQPRHPHTRELLAATPVLGGL